METKYYLCNTKKLYMEAKSRFKVKLSNEAQEFLDGLPNKVREKIISNIRKSTFVLDPDLFKKLDDTDIWEFRTFYNKTKYRLLAFWDKDDKINTLVIATHGFIKKTQKTPPKEIAKAEEIRKDYFNSKMKLFSMCQMGFVNIDDFRGARVKREAKCQIKTYGIDNACNLLAKDITITNSYVDFKVKIGDKNERVKVGIPGRFSVYNSLAAICVATKLGCSAENIKDALLEVRVPGRSELVNNSKDLTIMIDYAHSPESLENILNAVKSYTRGRVISVFGCGGDRDTTKRPIMGEISGKIADFTIITSDNPRTEDPQTIVDEIETGIKKTKGKYVCIVDRIEAIKYAINMASKKDIIVLAGKGHEPYQEINGVKHPFDERIIVNQIIKGEI